MAKKNVEKIYQLTPARQHPVLGNAGEINLAKRQVRQMGAGHIPPDPILDQLQAAERVIAAKAAERASE
jgi:hypothetical protein